MKRPLIFASLILAIITSYPLNGQEPAKKFYMHGTFYLDWYGTKFEDSEFYNQFSARLKMELINRRGAGWTFLLDSRDRFRLNKDGENQDILYDARLSFEKPQSPLYFSVGQMNLYDTAGIGQLLGGIFGFKPKPNLLLGAFAGLESSIYINRIEKDYQKYGLFGRYIGKLGKRFSLSYNHIRYSGMTEHQYIYTSSMFPLKKSLIFYGNLEYELGSNIQNADRLSRFFLNVRYDPARSFEVTAFYSSGRGLDFHRHILEKSQDPSLNDKELERYYYSRQYGLRFSVKPAKGLRVYISRQENEQKDENIRNHSWRIGGSALNILRTGISAYGSYVSNRGEISESDSYYISISKDFGRISWNGSLSNTYNSVHFDNNDDTPRILHLNDYKTISTFFFITINHSLAASAEYEYFLQEESNQHLFFIRLIFRK